jgi:hypothetical protein
MAPLACSVPCCAAYNLNRSQKHKLERLTIGKVCLIDTSNLQARGKLLRHSEVEFRNKLSLSCSVSAANASFIGRGSSFKARRKPFGVAGHGKCAS